MANDPQVHELLIQLLHELKRADIISERDQALFNHLAAHVQEIIEVPETPHTSLTAKLEAAIAAMEADHPILTTMMERVVSGLSNMGV